MLLAPCRHALKQVWRCVAFRHVVRAMIYDDSLWILRIFSVALYMLNLQPGLKNEPLGRETISGKSSMIRFISRAIFILFVSTLCRAESPIIAKVISIEYPPYTTSELPGGGISVDVLRSLLEPHGWTLEVEFLPPARAAFDVADPGDWLLSFFPPREGYSHVRTLVLKDADILFGLFRMHKPGPFRWQSLDDLAGSTLVSTRTLTGSQVIQPFISAGIDVESVNTLDQGLHMLLSGRADYVLTTRETGYYYAQKLAIPADSIQFSETIIQHFPHRVFVNINHPLAERVLHDLQP